MNANTPLILDGTPSVRNEYMDALKALFPFQSIFNRDQLRTASESIGKKYPPAWVVTDKSRNIGRGLYQFPELAPDSTTIQPPTGAINMEAERTVKMDLAISASAVAGMTGGDRETIVPEMCVEYVPWGHFADIEKIIRTQLFAPTYITGLSGNGKTTMIEQVCAKLKRECFRCNIVAETDEDDLLGGFRLINGSTVWQNGVAVEAMIRGAILLLDEIDLGSSKLMCLQPILEGKGVYLKKINKWIIPAKGFQIFATANTKGKGSDDGRFIGTNVMNEAMLDRFDYTYEQEYAPKATEKKIIFKAMSKFDCMDAKFGECLVKWAEMIRLLFKEGSIDEVVSTRRLVNITKAFSVFGDKEKAIKMCLARFDTDTSSAFFSAYTKIDETLIPVVADATAPTIEAPTT